MAVDFAKEFIDILNVLGKFCFSLVVPGDDPAAALKVLNDVQVLLLLAQALLQGHP